MLSVKWSLRAKNPVFLRNSVTNYSQASRTAYKSLKPKACERSSRSTVTPLTQQGLVMGDEGWVCSNDKQYHWVCGSNAKHFK